MDVGLTHIALQVTNLEASLRFYEKFARMEAVYTHGGGERNRVAWISDLTRPFVIVLVECKNVDHPLGPFAHLGVAVQSKDELLRLCELAENEGVLAKPLTDSGPPVGVWAFIHDPDGHTLELSYGQEVEWAVQTKRAKLK